MKMPPMPVIPQSGLNCLRTGNECGTDTWMAGSECGCVHCQRWFGRRDGFAAGLAHAALRLDQKAIQIRDNGPTSKEGLLTAIAGAHVGCLFEAAAEIRAIDTCAGAAPEPKMTKAAECHLDGQASPEPTKPQGDGA